jgi:EAL domain-containing protein (putative c-di-GMP-specific phosphodiesterase class I)
MARLPVNLLKIDRSFIARMTRDSDNMEIVATIISLAHSLKMKVIAEGVETEEQARILNLLRCDEVQGYYFCKPVPATEIAKLLEKGPDRLVS